MIRARRLVDPARRMSLPFISAAKRRFAQAGSMPVSRPPSTLSVLASSLPANRAEPSGYRFHLKALLLAAKGTFVFPGRYRSSGRRVL